MKKDAATRRAYQKLKKHFQKKKVINILGKETCSIKDWYKELIQVKSTFDSEDLSENKFPELQDKKAKSAIEKIHKDIVNQ